MSLILVWRFDAANPDFQFVEKAAWLASGITYHMGVDGISLPFVILTTALMPFCIVASWKSITVRVREYMMAFLLLETLMVGTFSALDLVLFYLFFEGGLIPMFLIIGVWGGPRRVYASFKFFLYTLLGSVLMLLAIMALYWNAGTTDIPTLMHTAVPRNLQKWAWLAFFASFAVKMPMWPVHTWLPDAHVEAPTAGSVILAAILLKMGGYGFLRFSLPMFPLASHDFAPLIFTLSVIAIVYTSLVALMQEDMKKLIAYSSVAHMGFVTMGIFAGTMQGVAGGVFQMISHGIVSGALFLCVGIVYDRMHTREIAAYGGLVNRMPLYALVFMVFTMANVGLPGTSGFVGEFMTLLGTFKVSIPTAFFATFGVILSAGYALWLYRKVVFGPLTKPSLASIKDLTFREGLTLFPLVALTILFGVYPKPVLDMSAASVQQLVNNYNAAMTAVKAAALDASNGHAHHELPDCRLSVAAGAAGAGARRRRHGAADARGLSRRGGDARGHDAVDPAPGRHRRSGADAAGRQARHLRRQLHRRRLCPLPEGPGPDRLGGDADPVDGIPVQSVAAASSNMRSWSLLSTLGMMVLISAGDLIMLYLGLELMSLALYVVAASNRDNAKSTEAGLKYFVLGALSSGMLLYGASLIYGFTGTVGFAGIAAAAKAGNTGIVFGLVFLLAGLCFKVSAVPFHMWTPDVYEGAPTPVTAFFASAPKVAALAVFTRVALTAFPGHRAAMAADHRVRRDRLDGARLVCRDRAEEHQATDGLFLDRPYGLCAGRPCRRHRRGRAGRADLYRDLCGDDARLLRHHPGHEAQRPGVEEIKRFRGPVAHQSAARLLLRDAAVLACRHSAARRLLRQMVRVRRRDQGRSVHARRGRRALQRRGRVLLSLHHQGDVFRRAGRQARSDARRIAHGAGGRGLFNIFFFVYPGPLVSVRPRRIVLGRMIPKSGAVFGEDHVQPT